MSLRKAPLITSVKPWGLWFCGFMDKAMQDARGTYTFQSDSCKEQPHGPHLNHSFFTASILRHKSVPMLPQLVKQNAGIYCKKQEGLWTVCTAALSSACTMQRWQNLWSTRFTAETTNHQKPESQLLTGSPACVPFQKQIVSYPTPNTH
jgi:hypothetical protein